MPKTTQGKPSWLSRGALLAGVAGLVAMTAACSSGGSGGSTKTKGVTITVALAADAPPKAALADFTQQTGIKVKWVNIDWDSLQTKISAAATAKTYFADATDVDWSRVGQLGKLGWFYAMDKYVDTKSMSADLPQLASFTTGGKVVGIPYDASFMVTTVNSDMFARAGVTTMPGTLDEYTNDLKQVQSKGISKHP